MPSVTRGMGAGGRGSLGSGAVGTRDPRRGTMSASRARMHERLRSKLRSPVLALVLVAPLASATMAAAPPSEITFPILHADCRPGAPGAPAFALFLNNALLATLPSTQGCSCSGPPLQHTFTDAATIGLFDPATCNDVRVEVADG